ncbi:hypothetical protein J2X61_006193 [Bacillus sp. 3255]|nr:hypothetical protein [Bacillus sp. 3255]
MVGNNWKKSCYFNLQLACRDGVKLFVYQYL